MEQMKSEIQMEQMSAELMEIHWALSMDLLWVKLMADLMERCWVLSMA